MPQQSYLALFRRYLSVDPLIKYTAARRELATAEARVERLYKQTEGGKIPTKRLEVARRNYIEESERCAQLLQMIEEAGLEVR